MYLYLIVHLCYVPPRVRELQVPQSPPAVRFTALAHTPTAQLFFLFLPNPCSQLSASKKKSNLKSCSARQEMTTTGI
jgi:hypothetical protein